MQKIKLFYTIEGGLKKFQREKEEFKLNAQEYALIYGFTARYIRGELNGVLKSVRNPKCHFYHIWRFENYSTKL